MKLMWEPGDFHRLRFQREASFGDDHSIPEFLLRAGNRLVLTIYSPQPSLRYQGIFDRAAYHWDEIFLYFGLFFLRCARSIGQWIWCTCWEPNFSQTVRSWTFELTTNNLHRKLGAKCGPRRETSTSWYISRWWSRKMTTIMKFQLRIYMSMLVDCNTSYHDGIYSRKLHIFIVRPCSNTDVRWSRIENGCWAKRSFIADIYGAGKSWIAATLCLLKYDK